ncbi:maltotransferase domain-containing protein [Brachybacterium sp. Z12]|uniref:maltotransferase domain-containing protein n=1 Tax=Brachybacterium sp. Z12 TaxID=2759167 RepID=UPI00223B0F01|nr:maltotransferase domain-containing protein [Brachybacterium sp. Z12]
MSETTDRTGLRAGIGRIPIMAVQPVVDGGRFPARCVEGETVTVSANAFREGHDLMGVQLVLIAPDGTEQRQALDLVEPGLDRWETTIRPERTGRWSFRIEAFSTPYDTWAHVAEVKIPAGIDSELVCAEGAPRARAGARRDRRRLPPRRRRARGPRRPGEPALPGLPVASRIAPALAADLRGILTERPLREGVTVSGPYRLVVERQRALYGSWYEFFPRSEGAAFDPEHGWTSGTFRTAARSLDRIAAMGFDVAYLTPIHPIGSTFRKGRNNSLDPQPGDPGSPMRSARRREAMTRSIPSWARWRTSMPSWPARRSSTSRSRWTSRCSARRTIRG